MSRCWWLASYPKSGNTWFRMIVANVVAGGDEPVDIDRLPEPVPIASAREAFDNILLVDSELLVHAEVDRMRPMLHRFLAEEADDSVVGAQHRREDADRIAGAVPLVKTHDGYTRTDRGEPLLGGAAAAPGAILLVRDPRDVAPSLAAHLDVGIDAAIEFMADPESSFSGSLETVSNQLRQQLLGWSAWQASWLDQRDLPVHLVRYEDMHADPLATVAAALAFTGRRVDAAALGRAVDLARFDRLQAREARAGFREAPVGRQFFRRGESGGWRRTLSAGQTARICADHRAMMERLGYQSGSGVQAGEEDAVSTGRRMAGGRRQ